MTDHPTRHLVLVGGGHAHVEVLRSFAMLRPPGVRVTVVMDRTTSAYSGMVPAYIAGSVTLSDLQIDVWPLARRAGATVIEARMTQVEPAAKRVMLDGRQPLAYDVCSIDIGGSVAGLKTPGVRAHAISTRPLATLLDRMAELSEASPECIAVVGSGPAGVELAFSLRTRFPKSRVVLVERAKTILPSFGGRYRRRVLATLAERQIEVQTNTLVESVTPQGIHRVDGSVLQAEVVLWATGAAPHPVMQASNLPVADGGFTLTEDTLQVVGFPSLFAAGDCAVPRSRQDLPRAGVYAVRAGPYLAHNLRQYLVNQPLESWRPQRSMLSLLNVCDGTAFAHKWGMSHRSRRVYQWKDGIDRAWLDRYRGPGLPQMPPMDMRCLGCAAKVPAKALERVLMGTVDGTPGEDAARIQVGSPIGWTVDVFPAFSDDAELVAHVAAVHALADLWAKGVRPTHALALVTVPETGTSVAFAQVMAGLRRVLSDHGIALAGGHTVLGDTVSVGLTAVGPAHKFLGIDAGQVGDVVLLTRPLGTGILLRADNNGTVSGADMKEAYRQMMRSHAGLLDVAERIHTATDVSGFGLAKHWVDLCVASQCAAVVNMNVLPVLSGVTEALAAGVRSTSAPDNEEAVQIQLDVPPHPLRPLLFDPQTGGGLLVTAPAEVANDIVAELDAVVIGRLVAYDGGPRLVSEPVQ
ncbi:MAG: selenide,water dikinase [Myxococcota bacterium]|jgi:selenide,water dikinase